MKEITRKGTVVGVPARREKVIAVLNEAFAKDLIEMEEYEERVELAEKARNIETLEELVEDIPENLSGHEMAAGPFQRLKSVLGSKKYSGNWLQSRNVEIQTILSNTEIDFRNTDLPPGVTELKLKTVLGSVELILPPGLRVQHVINDVMSSVEVDDLVERVKKSGDSILRISGKVFMGSVEIKVR